MNIGFLGTGKISSAIVEAICTSDLNDYQVFLSPRNKEKSLLLESKFNRVTRLISNQEVVDSSDIIFLALRPNIFKEVLSELTFSKDQSVISAIPFSTYGDLMKLISPATSVSRAIPLPTVMTHVCPIPVYKPSEKAMRVLNAIGQPFEVNSEKELHTIWTLTCLISPYYDMLNAIAKWASNNSVDQDLATKYVADMFNTLTNAAHQSSIPDFDNLSHHAATPGGLNEKTAKQIQNDGAHDAYVKAAEGILELFPIPIIQKEFQ